MCTITPDPIIILQPLAPRDDIESLAYVYLQMRNLSVPWNASLSNDTFEKKNEFISKYSSCKFALLWLLGSDIVLCVK